MLTAGMFHFITWTALIAHPTYDLQTLSYKYCSLRLTPGCAPFGPCGFDVHVGFVPDHHKNKRPAIAETLSPANAENPAHNLSGTSLFKLKN